MTVLLCEHVFVTSQGSAYARFRRALEARSVTSALACAAELKPLGLTDSLEVLLLIRDEAPARYGTAALRWHGRLTREAGLSLEEGQAALALLTALATTPAAAPALADLLVQRPGLTRLCETLVAWARSE
jgi:hypothetical protein